MGGTHQYFGDESQQTPTLLWLSPLEPSSNEEVEGEVKEGRSDRGKGMTGEAHKSRGVLIREESTALCPQMTVTSV